MLFRRNPNLKLRGGEQKLAMKAGDDTELVTMLLQAGSANMDGWKDFLEQAILRQNPRSTISLLFSMDHDGHAAIDPATILRAAILVGQQDMAYRQVAVCKYDSRALFETVSQSHRYKDYQKIVERLLETRPNIPNDSFEVLAVASAARYHDKSLLGVLMKALGQGPWVARFPEPWADDEDMFRSRWVPTDDEPGTPGHILDYAAALKRFCDDEAVIKSLLEANVPAEGMKIAIFHDLSAETWKKLIAAGANPKHPDLLLSAVGYDMLAHVEVLCEAQAPVNAMHRFNVPTSDYQASRTAVQLAVEIGSPEMLQMLVHCGGDVEHPAGYYRGGTCLQLAAGAGNIGLVRLLLDKGAKVNARRSLFYGRTSIEIAAENGRLDIVKLLLLQDKQLYQTTAERYQFIRATKMAKDNGHGVINKILREHINWNNEDQQLFDEIQGSTYMIIHLDDMTEMLLDSERRSSEFWSTLDAVRSMIGLQNIFETDGIEQWIGEFAEETSDDGTTAGIDCGFEGEDSMTPENGFATSQFRTATQETIVPAGEPTSQAELQSDLLQPGEVLPAYKDTHDALVEPADLQSDLTGLQSAGQWHAWKVDSETSRSTHASAPRALRYQDNNPMWLDMGDNDINNMMQDLSGGLGTQNRMVETLAHRPATQNVDRELSMVLGEVLDEAPHIKDMGDVDVGHNGVGNIGEAEHTHRSQFNWGVWDDETFALHTKQL
ncbi:hypothetical protein INS49_004429 [Diaporthe citri]|uniref:uncharacterized protein n=1 Tax=Diaporthe citri TaxID=83186 RepID=UPI001C7E2439|nr:uncharacterized protein INS49_004429 [Diaporthe citri]KAG6354412.1 hypothetical protein INS49_004429 [Diaporthe citri]